MKENAMLKKFLFLFFISLPILVFGQYDSEVSYYQMNIFKIDEIYEVPIEVTRNEGETLTFLVVLDTINPPYISPYGSYLYDTKEIDNDQSLWNGDEMTISSVIDYPEGKYEITLDGVAHWYNVWIDSVLVEDTLLYGYCTNALYLQVDSSNATALVGDPKMYGIDLKQNYPNPFNPSTTIPYSIKDRSIVSLHIMDITGKVKKIFSGEHKGPGIHYVSIDASKLASGNYIYFLRVQANGKVHILKKVFTVIK